MKVAKIILPLLLMAAVPAQAANDHSSDQGQLHGWVTTYMGWLGVALGLDS
jgi:hypothetical protein